MKVVKNTLSFFGLLVIASTPGLAQQNVYGCPGYPADSIFYARVDSLPVLPQSAVYTANMGTSSLSWDSSWGVSITNSHDPMFQASFAYTPAYNGPWRNPPYYTVDRQNGSLGGNFANGDHHTIVVETDTCTIWETYHAYVNPVDGSIESGQTCGGKTCNAQSGWKYDGGSYAVPSQGTTNAAGLPELPLIWRGHEILDNDLKHPVQFSMSRYMIQAGNPVWPANGNNGYGGTNVPSYGQRFRLKASAAINISSLSPQQQVYASTIITALQNYGLVLSDVGLTFNAAVDDQAAENPDIMTALYVVGGQIKPAQIEAVDVSSLKLTPASYQVANAAPALPRVMVGTPYHTFVNVQAGTKIQLSSWVNGPTTQKGVAWDVISGNIGTVTAAGLYTPPASVTGLEQGVLKVTSLADPSASSTVYVRVLPTGPIRIAAAQRTATITDHLGNVWLPNIFFKGGDTIFLPWDGNWAPPSNATQAAEMAIYEGTSYTYGNDMVTRVFVPNGTYSVRLMFGQQYNGHPASTCSPYPTQWHDHVSIELQNAIVVRDFDFGASINHACGVPVDLNLTTTVTNGLFEVALRNTEPDGSTHSVSPSLAGIEIIKH